MQNSNEFLYNYRKGIELLQQLRFKEALPYLEEALKYSRDPSVLINLSTALQENGDFARAKELLEEANNTVPESEKETRAMICYNMGNLLRDEGNSNESIRWYKEAITLRKNHRSQHYNLGQAYFALGNYDKALEQYEYILSDLNNNDSDAKRGIELILHLKKTGIKHLEHKEHRKMPPYKWRNRVAQQHFMEALKLNLMDDVPIEQVIAEFDEVLRLEPDNEDSGFWTHACKWYGIIALKERDPDLAKQTIEMGKKALRLHEEGRYLDEKNLFVLYKALTKIYFLIADYEEAERYCKMALNIVPESESMNAVLNVIRKAQRSDTSIEVDTSEKKRGCFIATAVYGSPYAPAVVLLKDFRDNVLQRIFFGKMFIWIYYHLSPFFTIAIRKSELLKKLAETLVVKPALRVAKSFENSKIKF
jgi:tetratricopeptide (TPR) repeat protein